MMQIDSPATIEGIEAFDDLRRGADVVLMRLPARLRLFGQAANGPDDAGFGVAERLAAASRRRHRWPLAGSWAQGGVKRQRQGMPIPRGECGLLYLHREEVRCWGSRRTPAVADDRVRIGPIRQNDSSYRFDIDMIRAEI